MAGEAWGVRAAGGRVVGGWWEDRESHLKLEKGALVRLQQSQAELERGINQVARQLPDAHIHLPRDSRGYTAETGLRQLARRGALCEVDGRFAAIPKERPLLEYYASSIRHLMPAELPRDSAGANESAATAGS